MRIEANVIIFDNLVRADADNADERVTVQVPENVEVFSQVNARGGLCRPTDIEELSARAKKAGARFIELFQKD